MIYRYYADIGGWRFVVLFYRGRKWIKLLDKSTLQVYRLPVSELRRLQPYAGRPSTVANRLARRRALFRRHNLRFSKKAVRAAISALREVPS